MPEDESTLPLSYVDMDPILSEEELIAESLVPYAASDVKKSRYLSYRATGFTITESAELTGITLHTVKVWRGHDPEFARLEGKDLSILRETVGKEFLKAEFTRNMRLCMGRDYEVLRKANLTSWLLTSDEKRYIEKVRPLYTPQQLMAFSGALSGDGGGAAFNITQIIKEMHTHIEVKGVDNKPNQLGEGAPHGKIIDQS